MIKEFARLKLSKKTENKKIIYQTWSRNIERFWIF